MISINHLIIAGNLTRDPVIKFLAEQRAVANFTIANSRRFKVNGEAREETAFIECEAWGKTAETLGQYFTKGKPIIVEGRLKQESWTDKQTEKMRSKLMLVVERFHFVPDGKAKSDDGAASADGPATAAPGPESAAAMPLNPAGRQTNPSDDEQPF